MVGRKDVGEVAFIDAVDLRGMVLDAVVDMDKGRIQVYGLPSGAPRPAAGQGLNRPALLTFRYLPKVAAIQIKGSMQLAPFWCLHDQEPEACVN